jgi:hypothetical protein
LKVCSPHKYFKIQKINSSKIIWNLKKIFKNLFFKIYFFFSNQETKAKIFYLYKMAFKSKSQIKVKAKEQIKNV